MWSKHREHTVSETETTQNAAFPIPDYNQLYILLWGLTGVGKSDFIRTCGALDTQGRPPTVGYGITSTTRSVVDYTFRHRFNGKVKRVTLVDVPGFNDADRDTTDIFEELANWLYLEHLAHGSKPWIHGIIYLHDIRQPRWQEPDKQCLELLERMCGERARENTHIVLSKADQPEGATELGRQFDITEEGLKQEYFQAYMGRVFRKQSHNYEDTIQCVTRLWDANPVTLQMLTELDSGKALPKTAAGHFLQHQIHDSRIARMKEKLKTLSQGSAAFKQLSGRIEKAVHSRKFLHRLDKQEMKDLQNQMHKTAAALAVVGAPLTVVPFTMHLGIPLLGSAALVEFGTWVLFKASMKHEKDSDENKATDNEATENKTTENEASLL